MQLRRLTIKRFGRRLRTAQAISFFRRAGSTAVLSNVSGFLSRIQSKSDETRTSLQKSGMNESIDV